MELLKSITVDATPSIAQLIRYALISALTSLRQLLLTYPINIIIFCAIVLTCVHKLTASFKKKSKFYAVYQPLPHHESAIEEVRLMKKDVREVQSELITILKKAKGRQQPEKEVENGLKREDYNEGEDINSFMAEISQKSQLLQQVQGELKQAVSEAFSQIAKLNQS